MADKVAVFRKDTGQRVWIPEHWVGHPTLGKPFRKTPPSGGGSGATHKAPATAGTATETKD